MIADILFGRKEPVKDDLEEARRFGEAGGKTMGDGINRYAALRVKPSLEGALTSFKLKLQHPEDIEQIRDELAAFLEWLQDACLQLLDESVTWLSSEFKMAFAIDSADHFRKIIRLRLTREVEIIAANACEYASFRAEVFGQLYNAGEDAQRLRQAASAITTAQSQAQAALEA